MKRHAIFLEATGEIVRIVACPEAYIGIQARAGEAHVEVDEHIDDLDYYVVDGEVVYKPIIVLPGLVDAGSTTRIVDIPEGTEVLIEAPEGDEYTGLVGADGVLKLLFHDVGVYRVTLTPPRPFNPATSTIEVRHAA